MDWVAEIGSQHKGEPSLAFELIRQFAQAGATVCKFQLGWPAFGPDIHGHVTHDKHFKRVDEWAVDLAAWCRYCGVEFMASIWSFEALELALSLDMKRLKVAHQIVQAKDTASGLLYAAILETGKPVFVSGLPSYTPIDNVRWLYCPPDYPTYPDKLKLPVQFSELGYYGYSSHTHGIADKLLAVGRGAQYVEAHVTLNKADHSVRDNHFALSPAEFLEMTTVGTEMRRLI